MQLDEVKHILSLGEIEMDCLMDATLAKEEQYKKLENYEYEVWCFWVDYLNYQKQMLERNIVPKKIVDIGCHLGIQSIIFDCPYLGIEAWDNSGFFWEKETNEYMVGRFPDKQFEGIVDGNIVISNMSLGYTKVVETKRIAKALKNAEAIFIAAPIDLVKAIAEKGGFSIQALRRVEFPRDGSEISGSYFLYKGALNG